MSSSLTQPNSRVASVVSEQRDQAREQIARLLDERFDALEKRLNALFPERASSGDGSDAPVRERARREAAEEFNLALRRLHGCETEEEWRTALVDASAGFCAHAVLLGLAGGELQVLRVRALAELPADRPPVAAQAAPAIAAAIESGGAVITLASAAEISEAVAHLLEPANAIKCAIVPVISGERTEAVLIAAGEPLDVNGLEAIAVFAGTALERRERRSRIPGEQSDPSLTREEEALRLQAQRFARVRTAEIRLYKAQAVRDGRANKNVYGELKEEIDSARAAYARQFLHASPTMPDYLHLELLRILANDEVSVLGDQYPGPLA